MGEGGRNGGGVLRRVEKMPREEREERRQKTVVVGCKLHSSTSRKVNLMPMAHLAI